MITGLALVWFTEHANSACGSSNTLPRRRTAQSLDIGLDYLISSRGAKPSERWYRRMDWDETALIDIVDIQSQLITFHPTDFSLGAKVHLPVSASILFGALSLIPQNRYIVWGLVTTSGIIYAANQQRPSIKLGRVEVVIESVEETLKHTKENCVENHIELVHLTSRLFEAKLSASKIQTRMLETRSVTTYKEFVQYLQALFKIMRDLTQCAKKAEEICTSTLRIIEVELQRQLAAGIEDSREIMNRVNTSSLVLQLSSQCTLRLHRVSPSDNEL
ncbi:hypothetical protein K438DRAFT_1783812 [Mycena galopus ATCC 62051]|nr:hypothetical protein K438DRAFT_1783812 [Mycena galopus ATCC 62051]